MKLLSPIIDGKDLVNKDYVDNLINAYKNVIK